MGFSSIKVNIIDGKSISPGWEGEGTKDHVNNLI